MRPGGAARPGFPYAVPPMPSLFGLPLGAEALAAMRAHVASHPKGKHGEHSYDLAGFGLTREGVRGRFAPYVERFGV